LALLAERHSFKSLQDTADFVARCKALPEFLDQLRGDPLARDAFLPSKRAVQTARRQVQALVSYESYYDHPLYGALLSQPSVLTDKGSEDHIKELIKVLENAVTPAYRRVLKTLDELEPLARGDDLLGIWALPAGEAMYCQLLKSYSSFDASPDRLVEEAETELRGLEAAISRELRDLGLSKEDLPKLSKMTQEDQLLDFLQLHCHAQGDEVISPRPAGQTPDVQSGG